MGHQYTVVLVISAAQQNRQDIIRQNPFLLFFVQGIYSIILFTLVQLQLT